MGYSGMISDIAVVLVAVTGSFFPLFSPLIGVIGGFVTGSGTSTAVLFGKLQQDTAAAISDNPNLPAWLCAANEMGGGVGKMICPQSIAIGCAAVGLTGSESKILGKVFIYVLLYAVIGGLICFFVPVLGLI
jgi:lactate permease